MKIVKAIDFVDKKVSRISQILSCVLILLFIITFFVMIYFNLFYLIYFCVTLFVFSLITYIVYEITTIKYKYSEFILNYFSEKIKLVDNKDDLFLLRNKFNETTSINNMFVFPYPLKFREIAIKLQTLKEHYEKSKIR